MHQNFTFLDRGMDAIFVCETGSLSIVQVNRRACELFVCQAAQLQGAPLATLSAPDCKKTAGAWIEEMRTSGEAFDWHVQSQTGRLFWLEMSVQGVMLEGKERWLLIGRDVTRRKLKNSAEQAKSERVSRKMAAFAEFNPNPVFEFSTSGQLRYCNRAAEELARSVGKKTPSEILPAETRQVVSECWLTQVSRLRLTTQLQDRTISWSFFPIATLGRVHCYAGDITDKLTLENQLRQSQKLEAIGQLAAGVAHDFNNILTIIQGNAAMVRAEERLSGEATECAEQIIQAADRAASLTRQLLVFSRKQILHRSYLNLNSVVTEMSKMLQPLLGEDIVLRSELSNPLPNVYADPGMMEQVLLNLAVNSRDAMPRGGQLVIRTGCESFEQERLPNFEGLRAGTYVCLSVQDSGCGIAKENLAHIFEPFFTTKEIGKGTGLGLATVYGIVHQHHGWIDVASDVGQGTTFKIYLFAESVLDSCESADLCRQALPAGKETILVVEDEAALREVVSIVLERCGYGILMAESGLAALEIWKENKDKVDLLFTDMVMPDGVSGPELVSKLTREKPGLKVICTSGYSPEVFAGNDFARPDNGFFLQKPYHPHRLAQIVRRCLDAK